MKDDQAFERALDGSQPGPVADLFASMRDQKELPGETTVDRHLAMMSAELSAGTSQAVTSPPGRWRHRLAFSARFAAGGAAGFMSLAGLAYAGVDLPGTAAERAIESVLGVELPNQAEAHQNPPADPGSGSASPRDDKGRSEEAPRGRENNRGRGKATGKDADRPRGKDRAPGRRSDKERGRSSDAPAGKATGKGGDRGRSSEAPGISSDKPDGASRRSDQAPSGNAKGKQGSG